jgi:hypothetical protein
MTGGGDPPDVGLAEAADTLLALDGPQRQGIITSRGRELLAALTPRNSHLFSAPYLQISELIGGCGMLHRLQ